MMMNKQEKDLERLVDDVNQESLESPPLYELYVTIFSLTVSIAFFIFPKIVYEDNPIVYENMQQIANQEVWAISFFVASMLKSIGLLIDRNYLRYIGLILSVIIYVFLSYAFAEGFPTLGSITFLLMAVFSVISLWFVNGTSIIYKTKRTDSNDKIQ